MAKSTAPRQFEVRVWRAIGRAVAAILAIIGLSHVSYQESRPVAYPTFQRRQAGGLMTQALVRGPETSGCRSLRGAHHPRSFFPTK